MKPIVALVAVLVAAQPAAATRLIELAPAAAPRDCRANAAACIPARAAPQNDTAMSPGQIIAGLTGLLVLGLVFGRRRTSLPQVVS